MTLLVVRVPASAIVPRERGRVVHHHGADPVRRCPARRRRLSSGLLSEDRYELAARGAQRYADVVTAAILG